MGNLNYYCLFLPPLALITWKLCCTQFFFSRNANLRFQLFLSELLTLPVSPAPFPLYDLLCIYKQLTVCLLAVINTRFKGTLRVFFFSGWAMLWLCPFCMQSYRNGCKCWLLVGVGLLFLFVCIFCTRIILYFWFVQMSISFSFSPYFNRVYFWSLHRFPSLCVSKETLLTLLQMQFIHRLLCIYSIHV